VTSRGLKTYDIELDQLRKEKFTEESLKEFEAIDNALNKIQSIINDIDKRISSIDDKINNHEARIIALENP